MGRFFSTDLGRSGKFIFGVQSSDDPKYLGMEESERTYIPYYAESDKVETITKKLDEQYDILGVDKKDRIYLIPKADKDPEHDIWGWAEFNKYEKKYLHDKVWETFKNDEADKAEKKYGKGFTRWGGDEEGVFDVEKKEGLVLALGRIRLALVILTDIEEQGYCSLEAELY